MSNKVIGIDLGTSTSCVSVFEGGQPHVIENAEGKRTTPSIVGFSKGERKVGEPAKRQAVTNPKNTVYEVKRLMGCKYDAVINDVKSFTYDVVNDGGMPKIDIKDEKKFTPEEISSIILQKMKKTAEDYIGEEVSKAVITVPAYFNDDQRTATINAGKIAGLDVLRIISEPTAAAISYGIDKKDSDEKILVFDFGGGTHDVSILDYGSGVFEVLATSGDTHLGGKDVDQKIVDWIADEFKKEHSIDVRKDTMALQRVREAAEKAKIELSSTTQTEINLPYLSAGTDGPIHFVQTLNRAQFDNMISDIVDHTIAPCKIALDEAGLSASDIDEIILVGGSTRIPAIQEAVKKFFGKEPNKSVNPDEAVSLGAAIQGAVLGGDDTVGDIVLLDVTPLNLGIETLGGVMTTLIDANTTIPCTKSKTFSTAVDNQPMVEINVLQGNRSLVKDNKSLGLFRLDGIPMAARGVPQIEVTFDIDANGVIKVSAKDLGTNKEQHITIEGGGGLSDEEIEKMKADAEKYKEEDKKKLEELETINQAESYAYTIEKSLDGDLKDNVTEDEKKEITEKIEALRESLKAGEIEDIKTKKSDLEKVYNPIVENMYKKAQEEQAKNEQSNATEEASSEEQKTEEEEVKNPFEENAEQA
jgi:molecular chaperone DnaK